jgi:hypothetical protein
MLPSDAADDVTKKNAAEAAFPAVGLSLSLCLLVFLRVLPDHRAEQGRSLRARTARKRTIEALITIVHFRSVSFG